MSTANIMVLGGPGTGKTHYAGQLLGRLRHDRQGILRLRPGGVDDLGKLEEVLSCLDEGKSAGHTAAKTWIGIRCELETKDGRIIALEWPEYAGERLSSMVDQRLVPPEWRTSISNADGWILFVRPSTLELYEDLLERPSGVAPQTNESLVGPIQGAGWDDRARYVELLQMLLFTARRSTVRPISMPRLAVMVSCWDELEYPSTPEGVFANRLCLLDAFVRSNWESSAWSIWGLSSLGRKLSDDEPDSAYATRGPEHFGYVVPPDSVDHVSDLTAPVAWLLGE